jgi:hypothetical protein
VALAAFFASLIHANHNSALLFDDPVCSLDHGYRHRVAARLVQEAAKRQIVVFTHDIVLLTDLMEGAREEGVPCITKYLSRIGKTPGVVRDGLSGMFQKLPELIDSLEKKCRKFKNDASSLDDEKRRLTSRSLCDDLRVCCERAIEQEIVNGTVLRFRDYISTKQLVGVAAATPSDCKAVKKLFDWASDWVRAHSQSTVRSGDVPTGDEILAKVDELKAVVANIKAQRKAI